MPEGAGVTVSAEAAERFARFVGDEPGAVVRLAVQAGGCAGFRYALFVDDRLLPGDVDFPAGATVLRVDDRSLPYLAGAKVTWQETLTASGVRVENPNASGGCACGASEAL